MGVGRCGPLRKLPDIGLIFQAGWRKVFHLITERVRVNVVPDRLPGPACGGFGNGDDDLLFVLPNGFDRYRAAKRIQCYGQRRAGDHVRNGRQRFPVFRGAITGQCAAAFVGFIRFLEESHQSTSPSNEQKLPCDSPKAFCSMARIGL